MPSRRAWVAIVLLFIGLVIWRLPASWLVGALPPTLRCEDAAGTAWAGQCPRLTVMGVVVQQVSWRLDPTQLLHAQLGGSLRIDDARLQAQANWSLARSGDTQLSNLTAQIPLPNTLLPAVPTGWSGQLGLQIARARYRQPRVLELLGRVQLTGLRQQQPPADLGGYELSFPSGAVAGDVVNGSVRDLGGPVTLVGALQLRPPNAYDFEGKVAATAAAGDELRQLIEDLGPADAHGLRVVSVAGTL